MARKRTKNPKNIGCYPTKSEAKKNQKKEHENGNTAAIRVTKSGYCIYTKGARKKATIKRTGQKIQGRKKK